MILKNIAVILGIIVLVILIFILVCVAAEVVIDAAEDTIRFINRYCKDESKKKKD